MVNANIFVTPQNRKSESLVVPGQSYIMEFEVYIVYSVYSNDWERVIWKEPRPPDRKIMQNIEV